MRRWAVGVMALAVVASGTVAASAGRAAAASAAAYTFSPSPMDPNGPKAGDSVTVTLAVTDASGASLAGASVYLSLTAEGGGIPFGNAASDQCPGSGYNIGSNSEASVPAPVACTADQNGDIRITYAAPSSRPPGGTDVLTAQDATTSPSVVATDVYSYGPNPFTFTDNNNGSNLASGTSIASAGTVTGSTSPVAVEVNEAGANPDNVDLWLVAAGSGTASQATTGTAVAYSGSQSSCSSATGTPHVLQNSTTAPGAANGIAPKNGVVTVCYTPPASLGEIDVLWVRDSSHTGLTADAGYNSTSPSSITLSPEPSIAGAGSLGSGGSATVTLAAGEPWVTFSLSLTGSGAGSAPAGTLAATCNEGPENLSGATASGSCTTGTGGTISMAYTAGTPSGSSAVDTLKATSASDTFSGTTSYTYATLAGYTFSPGPTIAATASLQPSATKTITLTAEDASGTAVPDAPVTLSFEAAHTTAAFAKGSENSTASTVTVSLANGASCQGQTSSFGLLSQAVACTTGSGGTISMTYALSGSPPTGGQDVLSAADPDPASGVPPARDTYNFSPVTSYTILRDPIDKAGSLGPNTSRTVTLTALASGTPQPGAIVYLQLINAANGTDQTKGSANATCAGTSGGAHDLGSLLACQADAQGQISIAYQTPSSSSSTPYPTNGADAIKAEDDDSSPVATFYDPYQFDTASQAFTFSETPLAPPGSLGPGSSPSKTPSVEALDASGNPDAGETELLSFSGVGSAKASCAGVAAETPIPSSSTQPLSCATNGSGQISIFYTTPQTLPSTGTDTVTVKSGSNASLTASDTYSFASTVNGLTFSPDPFANDTMLGPSATVPVTLSAEDPDGNPVPNVPVNLSFTPVDGGGSAKATCAGSTVTLTSTPQACAADGNGNVSLSYSTPATLPSKGRDLLTASVRGGPTAVDYYSYNLTMSKLVFSPDPVAIGARLAAGASVPVTLEAEDDTGAPFPGTVYLSFSQASGGGSATATCSGSTVTLAATPQACQTSSAATIKLTYKAPATLPTSGHDTINAADAATNPLHTAGDGYSFAPAFTFARLGGADRFETAGNTAAAAFPKGASTAVLVTGFNFPDALAASYFAGTFPGGAPILLVAPHLPIPPPTAAALKALGVHGVVIVGGPAAVGTDVAGGLEAQGYTVRREAGPTRFDTMAQVDTVAPGAVGKVGGAPTAVLATGDNFPDALAAGPIAFANHFPIVLTDGTQAALSPQAQTVLSADHIGHLIVVGGAAAINPAQYQKLSGVTIDGAATTGPNRAGTAQLLADDALAKLGFSDKVFNVANGFDPAVGGAVPGFTPDALVAAPLGGTMLAPTLVTLSPTDPGAGARFASEHAKTEVQTGYAFGGPAALAATTLAAIAYSAGGGYLGS